MMEVYRVGNKDYIKNLTGEGAFLFGGRWNYAGFRVIYTSDSLPLAILEYIVKVGATDHQLTDLAIAYIEIVDDVTIKEIEVNDLPENWSEYPAPNNIKKIGTDWLISDKSLLLKVPAVTAPDSFNILINPLHPEFKKVSLKKITEYHPDIRLKGFKH